MDSSSTTTASTLSFSVFASGTWNQMHKAITYEKIRPWQNTCNIYTQCLRIVFPKSCISNDILERPILFWNDSVKALLSNIILWFGLPTPIYSSLSAFQIKISLEKQSQHNAVQFACSLFNLLLLRKGDNTNKIM